MNDFEPWKPVTNLKKNEILAIKAMYSGTANEAQQLLFMDLLINRFCRTHDLPYHPNSARDSDFACGMQHVGKQILKYIHHNYNQEGELNNE